jgi:uncharacterized repeat protein (TIGR01451 family)
LRTLSLCLFLAVAVSAAPFVEAQESDVLVTKSGPAESAADTDVSYSVGVTNLGPDPTALLTLTDAIPSGMTFVSAVQDNGPAFLCTNPNPGDTVGTISCTIATLTVGNTANFTFVFHIPPATPPGTPFTNIANVATATDPNSENDSATAGTVTPFPPQGDMFITKSGPAGAGPDSDVVYTITIGNAGPDDASTVSLDDTLPGTMTFVSMVQNNGPAMVCSTPPAGTGGTVTCTAATFAAGASATFTLTGHIPAGTQSGTSFENVATVTSSNDPNSENDSSSSLLIVSSADVAVVKSGPPSVTAGDDITYTITVSNGGPDTALDVTLNDPLPPNTTFVSLTQNNGPVAACTQPPVGTNGTVSCNFVALANGVSAQFTLVVEAGNTLSVSNTATVTTTSADNNQGNNTSATVTTSVSPSADLNVVKTGPTTIVAGTDITYTVTFTNDGPSAADGVAITDQLPAGTTFVSATQNSGPTFNCIKPAVGTNGLFTCSIITLAPDAPATFTLVFHVSPSASNGSSLANTAAVATTDSDPNLNNNTSTTTATVAAEADLSVVKNGPTSIDAGSNITYTITLTNNGPSDATTVALTDNVPANTTFVSETQDTGPTFSCVTPIVGGTGPITCTLGTFTPGSSATFTLVMNVSGAAPDGSSIVNTADVTSVTTDPTPGNNTSTTTAIVAADADLAITKSGPASADVDSNVTYVVSVTNNGPADALNVSLTDILPPNTTFVSITQTVGPTFSCATPPVGGTGTITCTIASLADGATASFDIVLHIDPLAAAPIANTAAVTSPNDPTPINAATAVTAVITAAGIPTLSPLALVLMALSLAGIVLFMQRP